MRILIIVLILSCVNIFAQVGINTTTPRAALEVEASDGGVLIPRVALTSGIDEITVINPQVGSLEVSTLVYNSTNAGAGINAVTPGFYYWNGVRWLPVGSDGRDWSIYGNSGTNTIDNFIGTTDDVPLNFRVNNEVAGRIDSNLNTGITSFGYQNLENNIGIYNSAFGFNSLLNNHNGFNNTAFGYSSLRSSISTSENTALGSHSGYHSTGSANTFLGSYSGFGTPGESSGSANTAVGHQSMGLNRTGSQNTAMGDFAMFGNHSGNHNTAVGAGALDGNISGHRNTSIGFFSGRSGFLQFLGNDNVYIGNQSGFGNTEGSNNILIGSRANVGVNNLQYAVAIGSDAVVSQSNSIALGGNTETTRTRVGINTPTPTASLDIRSSDQTSPSNSDGLLIPKIDTFPVFNPNLEQDAMLVYLTTTTGDNLPGFYYWNQASTTWLPVGQNNHWNLMGNSGTVDGLNYIGTTDDVPLNFRVNNEVAGRIDNDMSGNTSIGYRTLNSIPLSGSFNTAFGFRALSNINGTIGNVGIGPHALQFLDMGDYNIAIGHNAMRNTNETYHNIAIGNEALFSNGSGFGNVAIGNHSSRNGNFNFFNTTIGYNSGVYNPGSQNTYIGALSGNGSTNTSLDAYNNTAVGFGSLQNITTGQSNSAFGLYALSSNNSGVLNSAFGSGALERNLTGDRNTAIGTESGYFDGLTNFTGSDNVYLGYRAGNNNTQGNNNTFIGTNTTAVSNDLSYAIAIGSGATIQRSNAIALGGNTLETQTNVGINQSNPEYSLHINQIDFYGLALQQGTTSWELFNSGLDLTLYLNFAYRGAFDFITGVYTSVSDRRLKSNIQPLDHVLSKVNQLKPSTYTFIHDENQSNQIGFIAQEVEELFPEFVHYNEGSDGKRKQEDVYTMDYSGMSVIAIKAIQEQQKIIEELEHKIKNLEEKISRIQALLEK